VPSHEGDPIYIYIFIVMHNNISEQIKHMYSYIVIYNNIPEQIVAVVVLTPGSRGFVNQVDLRRRQPHGPPSILSKDREM